MPQTRRIALASIVISLFALPATASGVASQVSLGSAADFAVLGGQTVPTQALLSWGPTWV